MNNKNHFIQRWFKVLSVVLVATILACAFVEQVHAAVAYDTSSESHTGTTGATSVTSFNWNHTPVGTPRGVLVFVTTFAVSTNYISSVTYDSVAMTRIADATDTNGELARNTAFYLDNIGSGQKNIVVNLSSSNANHIYATAITVTASGPTEAMGTVLLQEQGTFAVQSVNDGSPGTNSMRFAVGYSGGSNILVAGTGSTVIQSMDRGVLTNTVARESTAGQGARNVGFTYATSDDRAAIHLAVREIPLITVSGTIYQSNESSVYDCSAVTAVTVKAATNGGATASVDCTSSGGTYSLTTLPAPSGANIPIVVFIDSGEAIKATTVTLSAGTSGFSNFDLYVDRVTVTQESATAITNAHLATADNTDAGIRYAVSGGNLTVESNIELHVKNSKTYAPGGNVTTQGTGGIHLDDSSVLTGATTQAHISAGSLVIDTGATYTAPTSGTVTAPDLTLTGTFTAGGTTLTLNGTSGTLFTRTGTFTANSSTVVFNGDGSPTALTSGTFQTTNAFNNVSLTPAISTSGRTYPFGSGALTINGAFMINPSGTQLLTVNMGADITAVGTTTIQGSGSATSSLVLRPASTDYNLTTGLLNIGTAGTLNGTSTTTSTITLTGTSGTLFTRSGTFTSGGSTVIFNPDAAVTLTSGTFQTTNAFNNVSLTPAISSSGRTYTFGAGAIEINGDFLIQPSGTQLLTVAMAGNITVAATKSTTISRTSTATSTLNTNGSNPALSSGSITVATGGTLNGTGSTSTISLTATSGTPLSLSGDNYTEGTTTIAYAPASGTAATVASTTYYNVIFNRSGMTFSLTTSGITVTNDLTITAGVLDTVSGSNFPITVGRNWTNTPGTGGFLAQQGTVTFNTTTAAAITGATIFYNFSATTAPKAIDFGDATTFRINGLLTLTGSAGPNYITLDSVTGGSTQWFINHQGTENITYTSVKNSGCSTSTDITATGGTNFNAGNNDSCWLFPATSVDATIWKFDEGQGDTLYDAVANAHSGTRTGTTKPAWNPEDMCISGKCLYFDGLTSTVTGATTINIKTISFWMRPTSTTTTILQVSSSAYISASSGTLSATGFATPTFYVNGVAKNTIEANRWQHITVTTGTTETGDAIILGNNSTNYFKGFLDEVKFVSTEYTPAQVKGEFVKRGSVDEVSAQFSDPSIGQHLSDGLIGYWKLDEASGTAADSSGNGITLTNNATTTFVTGKFNRGSEHVPASSQYLNYVASTVDTYYFNASDSGPTTSNWTNAANGFDGSTSTYASSTTIDTTMTAGGTNSPTSGNAITQVRARAYGCAHDNSDGGAVIITVSSSTQIGTVTISESTLPCTGSPGWTSYTTLSVPSGGWTWQKVNDLTLSIVAGQSGSADWDERLARVEVEVTSGSTGSLSAASSVSFWTNPDALTNYYINLSSTANIQTNSSGVIAANGFTDPKIYVNGVEGTTLVANQWQLVTITSTAAITVDDFAVGKVGTSNYFDGTMDEVRLYNRVLDAREVATIYNWGPSPVAYFSLDENNGTSSVYDQAGNNIVGDMNFLDASDWVPGKFGSALDFGTDISTDESFIDLGDQTALEASGNSMTVMAWVKLTSLTNEDSDGVFDIIAKSTSGTGWSLQLWNVANDGDLCFTYENSSTVFFNRCTANLVINDMLNQWVHVAGVFDRDDTTKRKIYVNGVDATYVPYNTDGTIVDISSSIPAYIGGRYSGAGAAYNDIEANIDEVKIYNYARTSNQIVEDMNGGHPSPGSPVGSANSYYKFDEGYSTIANDSAPAGNALTLSAATVWTNGGKYGKAYQGASNQRATRTNDPDFNFSATQSFSFSGWFKRSAVSAQEYLIYREVTNEGYGIWLDSDGDLVFGISDTNSGSFPEESIGGNLSKNYDDDIWHHFVAVKDGNSAIKLYVDGKKIAENTSLAVDATLEGTATFYLGDANATDGTDEFLGTIDELRLYRLALTDTQVIAEMNQGKGIRLGSSSSNVSTPGMGDNSAAREYCVLGSTASCASPIHEYMMNENTGSTVYDTGSGSTARNGTFAGTTNPTFATGQQGSAVNFIGSNSRLDMGAYELYNETAAFTFSVWLKIFDTGGDVTILGNEDASNSTFFWEDSYAGSTNAIHYCGSVVCDTESLDGNSFDNVITQTNTWYHVAMSYDGTGTCRFYVNGIDVTADSACGETSGAYTTDIGGTTGGFISNHALDSLRIYDYVRTPAQIAWEHNQGGPAAWYKMDECTGTDINDSSGNSLLGSLQLGAGGTTSAGECGTTGAWANGASGKINSSMDFDGTDDYVLVNDNPKLDITKAITIAAWVRPDAVATCCHFVVNKDDVSSQRGYGLLFAVNGKLSSYFFKSDSTYYQVDSDNDPVPTGQWSHIAVTYDVASATAQYYVNGKPIKTNIISSTGGDMQATTSNLWIGRRNFAASYHPFDGKLDDVRIYSYAATSQQIFDIYNGGTTSFR